MRDGQVISYTSIKRILSGIVNRTINCHNRYMENAWTEEYDRKRKTFGFSFTIRTLNLNVNWELTFIPEDNQTATMKLTSHELGKDGVIKESEVLTKEDFWIVFPSEGRKTNIYPCFIPKNINGSTEFYKSILEKQQKRKEKRQAEYQGFIDILQETVLDAYKERGEV